MFRKEGNTTRGDVRMARNDRTKKFRLSSQEAVELEKAARKHHMSQSEYLRRLIYSEPRTYPEIQKLLKDLTYQIYKLGVDVNQIAKHLNSGGKIWQEDCAKMLHAMDALKAEAAKVVTKVGNCKNDSD